MNDDLKQREESKRERNWDPRQRWLAILQTIAWAEAQQPVPRNSKQSCLARQAQLNNTLPGREGAPANPAPPG